MFYIEDLAARELHGPFASRDMAHQFAYVRKFGPYRLMTDRQAQNSHYIDNGSFRLVPSEWRRSHA